MSWSRKNNEEIQLASEINMVPLIDVMLVLLVIFILTAPLLTHSIPVNLPQTQAMANTAIRETKPLEITILADGSVYYEDQPVSRVEAQQRFLGLVQRDPQCVIHIRADEQVPYRFVAETIADIKYAGLQNIGLVNR